MIVVDVELPVEKVPGGNDAKRAAEDRRPTMRGRTQPYHLWPTCDRLVVTALGPGIDGNQHAHPPPSGLRLEFLLVLTSATNLCKGAEALAEPAAIKLP